MEQEVEAIDEELERLREKQTDIDEAIEAIETLDSGSTVQVPLGGDAYLRATSRTSTRSSSPSVATTPQSASRTTPSARRPKQDSIDERIATCRREGRTRDESYELEQQAQQMQQQQMQQMSNSKSRKTSKAAMFDGLKDKLSGFTSDVEEDVDDDALEAEDEPDADEADGEAPPDQATESDPVADAQASEGDTAEPTAETDQPQATNRQPQIPRRQLSQPQRRPRSRRRGCGPRRRVTPDDAAETEEDAATEAESESDEDDDDGGRGLAAKAKLMATGKTVIEEEDLQSHLDDLEWRCCRATWR